MEILVLIKQVPDDSVDIKLDAATGKAKLDGVSPVTNAFDTYALEMATRYKEANGGNITVASIGDDAVVSSLKECLAVGGDKAFLVSDPSFADLDTTAKAYVLSKVVEKLEAENGAKFDIVFCGREATDFANGAVAIQLASELGVGCMTEVIAVDPADAGVTVKQQTDTGYNVIALATPCVVAIQKPDYDPRFPTIKNKMKARKATVPTITAADLGVDADKVAAVTKKVLGFREPPKRQAGVKLVPSKDEPIADIVVKAVGMMADAKVL